MKDVRFYLEFPTRTAKKRSGRQHIGHSGNVQDQTDLERLKSLLQGVEVGISIATNPPGARGNPMWLLDIPSHVTLECPHCNAKVECEVEIDAESNRYDGTRSAHAEIDHAEFCEDCQKEFCPQCPRFPHPDDAELRQCPACQAENPRLCDDCGGMGKEWCDTCGGSGHAPRVKL